MDPTKDFPDLPHYQSDLLSDINSSLLFSHPTMFGIASSQPSPSPSSSFNFMSATSNESSSSPFTALQGAFGSKKTAINKRSPQNRGPRSSELRGVGNRNRGASNSTKLKRLVSGHGKGIGRSARRSLDSIPNLDFAAVNQEESLEALIGEKGSLLEDSPEVEEQWAGKVCALCCHGERSQLGQGELIRLEIPLDHEIMRQAHRNQSAPEDPGHADKIQKPPTPLKKPRLSVKSRRSSSMTGEASLSEVQEELNNVGYTEDPDLSSVFESTGHFFVHHWCAMWCVGGASAPAAFPSASQLALVIGQCLSRRCNYCSGLGATLLCAYPSCTQNFHWPCAVASGAFLNIKTWAVHCPEHVHQGSVEAKIDGVCTSCGVPGEVTNLMGCTVCGNHWHGSCLGLSLSASVRVAWQCTDCKICVGCHAVGEDNKLLVCDACDKSYHPYCVRPHLSNIPKMGWKCKNCRVCGDCGSRTPGSGPSSRWHACFSVCDSCYQQRNKGAACPLCGKAYRHSQREMSHCHVCRKYVHASCDPEADRSLCARKKELNPDYEYQCPVCKAGGGAMTPKTPLMGIKKEIIGDEDELTRGSDVHTPSEESSMSMDVDLDKLWKDVEDGGKGYHGDKGKPGLASGGGKGGAGRKRMPPGRPKGVGKTGSIWNLSSGQTASQKRSKPGDFVKKRGPKPKMRGVFGAPGVTLQRPAGEPAGREEEPGTENKLVLCSSQDEFVLGQDVCVLCGALGLDAEGRLISCAQCGQCFHPYCANVKLSKVLLTKGWRCLECTVCEGCGQRNDEARLLLCDDCDISYHIYCMDPPLENVPPGNWKCKWCAVCTVCGSQERGRNSTWQDSYSKCGPCGSLTQCPVCNNAYADAELLIQCTACDRWLHGNCDSIRNESDAEICSAQDYQCLMCRPAEMPPPHLLAPPPPVLPVPPSLKLSNTTPPPPPSPSVTTPTSVSQMQASTSTVSKTSTTLTPSTLAPPASPAQYVVDGIALSETGMRHLQSLRLTDTPRRRMRKPKGQPANDSEAIWATIESVVSGGVARPGDFEHEKDGEGEEMDMPKDGTILQPREDGRMPEVPEGYSVVQGDGGVLILRKKRQRNLQKLGIGGFQLRRPWARTKEDGNISNNEAESGPVAAGAKEGVTGGGAKECGTGGESAGGGDKPKRKMQRRKNKTNRLAESYPSYLQEAFFGKELLDVKKDESSDKESEKEEEKVVSEKSVSIIHLSKDELAALEALKMRNDPEYRRQQLLARAQQQQQQQQQLQQSSAFPRPAPPPQACAFISSRTSSLESSLAPPTPRLSQDSLKLEEEGAGDADDEGDETLKDLLPSDLLDTDDLVDSIMKEAEAEDRGHLDKNSSDSRGDRKDEFRDLLAGLDPGLPTMDSKDVEDLFKGVLTDESQESQDSSLLSITATPPPSQLSIYPAPPSVNPVQPSNFGPSSLDTAGAQVVVPAPSHSAAAGIPNPLSQRILPTQVSSPSPYPSAADQNSPGFSPGFSEPPSPWPAGAGAGLGDSDAEPGPVASANQRNALKWEVDEALGTNATISAVLYANTNHPELKRDFPDWNNRWKQIAKIWRGLPPEKKAPFLQKARENRAAMRLVKQNQDTEVKAPPTPRRTNTESDQERQWKQMQAMRQQQQAAAASDVNRALGDATVQQQPHTADSYTQPRTPFTPPIQVSRVRAPGPDFMRPPMAEQYGMIPRPGEDKTLMKPEVGGTLGGEGMQGPAPAPAPHHQQQLLNLLRPPGPEGHVAFRQPLPPPQGQNMRLPMRMPSNGVPGQPMEFRHPAQVASNNVDPRFSGMPDPRMRMMQQRLPQPMQTNTGLGVMMNPAGYAPQTASQRILHTNATAAPVGITPMLPDGGIVKTPSELEAGPALLHPDSVKDELATLVGVESNNGAGTGSKGVAAGTGLTATDVEAAELSDMGIDDDDLLGLGNDFNILEYADPELQDADSCAGRGGSASADATDFNILEFAEGDGDADLDTGDEPTRKLEDKTTTSIKDEEGLQEFQAKLLEFSQEQQRREAAEASQGAPQNSVGADLAPSTEVSHLPPDFGFGQPPPPYRGPPPPYPGPRPQEQPLLLEDLLEQEKRELQRQQMARGVVGVPPAATSPDKPFLSDTDFEKLKADVLAGDHVVSLSPPAPPTHHVPQTSMAPIIVKPPQPQLQHQQPLRQPLQHPMIGGVAQHHPVHQHPQLAPPSQQQQQPRIAFHPPPPQQQWTNINVVDNSNNSIHPAMLSIPPQAQSPAPQPRPSMASNAPNMNFPMQLIPAPPLPPENPTNEAERQQQNNYEQWLYQQQNAIRMQQTYYEAEVNKFRKQRKSLNSRQRQLRKNGQELGDVDASELDRITAEQSGLQKQLDQVRRQARQHTMLMQDYRNKQQKRQQMMGGTLQDVPNLPPAQQQQQQQLQQQPHSPAIPTPLSLNQQMSPRSLTGTPQSLMSPGPMRSPMTPMAPSPGLQQAQQQSGMILSPAQPQHSPATMLPSPRMPPQSLEDASSGSVGSPFSPGLGSPPGINNPTHRLPTPQNYPPRLPSPQAAPLQPQQRFMVSQNQTPPPQQQQLRMVGNNPMMMNRYTAPPGALRAQIQQQDPSMALRQRFQGHAMGSGGVNPSQNINLMRPNYPNQQQQFYTQQQQQHSPQPQMQMMANQQRPLTGMQGSPRPVPSPSTCAPPAISPCANAASPMRRPSGGTGPALFPSASPNPALERPQSVENPATPRSVGHGPPTPGSHPSSRAQTPLTPSEPMNHIGTEMEDGNAKMFQQQQQQFHQQQQLQQQQQQQAVNRQVPIGYNSGNGAGNPNYAPPPRPMYTGQNMYNYNPSMGNNSGNVTMSNQPQQFGQQVRAMRQPTPALQNTAYYQQPSQKPFMLQQQQQQQQRPTIRQPMQPQQPQLLSPNTMQVQQQQQFFPQYQQQQQQPQTHTMNHNNQMMQQRMVAPQQQQQQPQQQQWVQQQQQQQYYNASVNQQYVQQSPQQQQQQFSTMNQQMNLQNTNMHQQQMQMQNNANQQQRQQQQQYRVPNPNYPARMTPSQAAPQTPLSELNESVEEHKDLAVTPSAPAPVSTPTPAVEDNVPSQSMDETPVPQSDGNGGGGGGGGVAGQVMPFPEGFVYIRLGLRGGAPPTKSSERVTQQGISEEAKKENEPSCMDTPTEVFLMHVKQERIETVTNGEMTNEEMKIETDSTPTQVSYAFGEREKMAMSPKDQQIVKEEKPDLEIEEINERKGNMPSTTPLESGQQNALLKQLLQGSSPTPTRIPLQTPPTCTTSQSMGNDKISNGEATPSLRTMLTSPIPRTSGTSLLGVSSLELQLAKPIAPPPTSIPSAQIAQIASRVPQATPITAFATVNQSTRPTAVSAATSVSTVVTTPTTPAPRFLQPVVRLERAAVPAPAPPLPVVPSTAPVVSEPIRRLSTTDAPVGEMPTVKTESLEQEAMANDIKAESVLPDPRKESEEARKLKRRQYQQKRRQNSLNAANSNSGTALASTSTAGKESSSHPHPASGSASIIGSSQPKKRLRKGSKLDEDYDAHIETVMTQLRTLPPVSIMEPSLAKNWAVCPVFGLGDVNKLAKSKSYHGDLTGDYAHAQHVLLPDFYNIKPFGDREPVPKKLPVGGIGLPLPDDPTKRGFYHQEFGWPKFGAAVTDSLRAAGASPDRDTDTPDTIVSSSSPECVYPDPPCRFPGLRYIEDETSEEDRSPARKCNSPPIPLYAPVALRPWQKTTPLGLPPTPTPPPQPAANVKIQPVEDKENKNQGVVGTTLTLPPSAPVRQVTKPSEGLIREQEALKAHFGLGRGLSPPLPLKDSGNVTVTLTLSAAAAEDVTGVLNKLAALLQVDPPTSYQIVERNPTPPSQKLGLYKGKSVDGKDAPGVDLSSVLQGQAKFCRHCDVVILGPGIVKKLAHLENSTGLNHKKTAEDMEVEEDDGDDSTGEDCSFCSSNCYMQFALSHRVHLTSEEKAAATIVNHSAEKNEKEPDSVPSKPTVTIKEEPVVTSMEKPAPISPATPAAVTVAPSVKEPVATLAPVPAAEETPLPMPPPPPAAVPPLPAPKTVVAKVTEELPVTSPAPLVLPAVAPPALPTPVRRFRGVRYKVFNAANPLTPPQGKKYKKPTENELTEMLYRLGTCIRPAQLPDDTRQCMFCHQTGDGISDGPGRLLNYDVDRWVHLNCALWSEEVYETVNGALMHVDVALRQSLTSICQHCNQNGATIKCWKVRCSTSLHLHCAVKEGCVFYKNKSVFCAAHAPRENKDEQLTTLSVYRRVYINRDDNRQVAAVMHTPDHAHLLRVGSLIFLNVGQLLPHQLPAFHSHHYIYPIGYKIARLYWSHRVAAQRCRYICTIEEAQGRPQFVVTVEESERGYENVTYTDWTAQGVWLQILKPLQALRQESGAVRLFPQFVSGEDLFGLTEPAIVRVLESLPGVDSLTDYHFKYGRNPLLELPLAVNPTGCARSEPRIKAGAQVKKPHTQRTGSSARSAYTHSAISALDPHGPYSKQFVHSKSSQYKKMKLEWRNNVYLARSKIQGLGLYASRDLEKHTMVIEYIGEVIRAELAELREKRYEAQNRGIYMFRLDEHRVIDATISGGLARYINHSCNPNCVAEVVEVERDLRIIIFANRRIARGEELNYDYKFDIEDDQHKISCLCGAPNCKKWMN